MNIYQNVNMDSWAKTEEQLRANGNSLFHSRTKTEIIGTSLLMKKRISRSRKAHLKAFPRVKYHNQTNKPEARIFKNHEDLIKWINGETVKSEVITGKPTSQWKTVWFSKHSRRQ